MSNFNFPNKICFCIFKKKYYSLEYISPMESAGFLMNGSKILKYVSTYHFKCSCRNTPLVLHESISFKILDLLISPVVYIFSLTKLKFLATHVTRCEGEPVPG